MEANLLLKLPEVEHPATGWPWTEESEFVFIGSYPRISIVMPSLNQGQYIEEAIRSVLLQNYPNLEFIIIDGGSTDNTLSIIEKYKNWISYYISEPDHGQSHAINKGIKLVTGDIFNWLNSDDYLLPGSLFAISNYFSELKPKLLCGYMNIIQNNRIIGKKRIKAIKNPSESILSKLCQPSMFYSFSEILKIGSINENLHHCMDLDLFIRFLILNDSSKIINVEDVFSNFRIHERSKTFNDYYLFNKDRVIVASFIAYNLDQNNQNLPKCILEMSKSYGVGDWPNMIIKRNEYLGKSIRVILDLMWWRLGIIEFSKLYTRAFCYDKVLSFRFITLPFRIIKRIIKGEK